jgi:hypothetical protein
VKHGASAEDLVADALRNSGSIPELVAVLQGHKNRLTALHASCALGSLYNLCLCSQIQRPNNRQSTVCWEWLTHCWRRQATSSQHYHSQLRANVSIHSDRA